MQGSNIILATDLSDNARFAAKWAHAFAEHHGISVIAAHVVSVSVSRWAKGDYDVLEDPEMMAKAEQNVRSWYHDAVGQDPDEVCVLVGHTAVQLQETVDEHDAGLLVLSASGKGAVKKFLVGSTAQSVANDPPCPVVVVEPEHSDLHDPPRIVVGIDYSTNSSKALSFSARLAGLGGAKLHIVHADTMPVVDIVDSEDLPPKFVDGGHYEWARDEMEKMLDAHKDELAGVDYDAHVIEDSPAKGLLGFVEDIDADMVVVGRSGHSQFVSSIMGSVVLKVLQSIAATTVIVPTDYGE